MNSSSILGCQIRVSLICASVVLFFYIRIVVWESFLLRFSFYSRSFGLVLYCMYPIVISLILIICFAISCLCLCHSAVFLLSMLSCVLLRCISTYSDQSNTHHLLRHIMPVFMSFGGIPSIDAFVCATEMYFHVSMCVNACPLLSAYNNIYIYYIQYVYAMI